MTSAFLLLGGGALLGNRFRTCLIENERLGVNGVSGVGNAGAFTALCTRCVGIARRVVVSASVCSRERTRRGHRACPYASRESITPIRRVAPLLGSRAWKKRPQHALLVGTRYSPSRKPFLKRRGRVLRYLMRPVPVVRRPMALTDQLSVEKKTRGAEGQWPPGGDAVGARERLAVGQIHVLGRGERRTPRGDAVGARERLRVKCHAQDGGAARVRHFAERKNSRALRERDLSLPCRVAGRDTHSFACGRWGSRTRHRWPFGCGRIGVHTCWVGRSTGGGMAVRRRSRDMKFTRSRGNPRNDRGICERRRRLARTLARTLTCGTACATYCAVYRSSRSLFRFSPWLKSNRRDARRVKG